MAAKRPTKKPARSKRSNDEASYHHGDLRSALIRAGLEILKTEGAHGLSLREVARRVGVSHMAPYRHFPDKEALMAAIAEEGFLRLGKKIAETVARFDGNPRAQLEEAGVAYMRFAFEDTEHLRVMLGGFVDDRDRFPAMRKAAMGTFEALCKILTACQRAKVIREGDPKQQALTAWASVHGISVLLVEDQLKFLEITKEKAESVTRGIARTLIAGLAA